jgi:DNA repair exonuclease SbcCD ATPase subunit
MARVRLKSLRLKSFRSFVEESTIHFPDAGMVLCRGYNEDTGGSSGSGKSSLLLAISYLLGFCRFPATALQSWLTEEPMEVSGTFEIDDGHGVSSELIISRGRQQLAVSIDGEKLAGSIKQLEEKITQYIGLPPELLAALTYRGQKEPGLFLSKTDAEKKEFLTMLLDLGKFEDAVEASQAKAKEYEANVASRRFLLEHAKAECESCRNIPAPVLQNEENLSADLACAQAAWDRIDRQIKGLRASIRQHESDIEDEVARLRREAEPKIAQLARELNELKSAPLDLSSVDRSKLEQLYADVERANMYLQDELAKDEERSKAQRAQANTVYAQLMLLEQQLAKKPVLEARLVQLQAEIAKLEEHLCPTCERQWDDAQTQRDELLAERTRVTQELKDLDGLGPQIAALQDEHRRLVEFRPSPDVEELRLIVSDLNAQIAVEERNVQVLEQELHLARAQQVADLEAKIAKAEADMSFAMETCRSQKLQCVYGLQDELEVLEREARMLAEQIQGFQAGLARAQVNNAREMERWEAAKKRLAEAEMRLTQAEEALAAEQRLLNAELDFQKLIGREGFLGAIFDEVLWEISEEVNRLLAQFPHTAHVTLRFVSETSTQKGTIKKSITPVVTVGGFEAPLSSGLSGGMETAVELAVDLAVASVVSRRTGVCPSWLILDEAFTGLGPVEAEASMEILQSFAQDRLVLVVDHASEFQSLFVQFVDVKYQNGKSRVE